LFDAIMTAREQQAKNMAKFIYDTAKQAGYLKSVYIHGKAYKPNVAYTEGSYSLLVGHYLEEMGVTPYYLDPLTEDIQVQFAVGVFLLAHNQQVTYGYAGTQNEQPMYCEFGPKSIVIDPWRTYTTTKTHIKVIHYGNTRLQ
jgi:hypothetical protein